MAARASDVYGAVPPPTSAHAGRGYGPVSSGTDTTPTNLNANAADYSTQGHPGASSPLAQSVHQPSMLGSSEYGDGVLPSGTPSRSGTLKKKNSLSRKNSLKRSGSRKSLHAGSIKGVPSSADLNSDASFNNIFYTPIPTQGSPTEVLANRFQAWRKFLKDLVAYFREVQKSYEARAHALLKVSNVINNTNTPTIFLSENGLNEANRILRDYHKQAISEANKARDIENDVVLQLNGLRADLSAKIKEIKSLAGDFKNSVEKEKESTRRAVEALTDALRAADHDPASVAGKGDPYVVKLGVDRQIERQIDEENYLHRAYLNLENSGRELEAIVVGEIQKAYNTLAGILKRDADEAYDTVERLRTGPIAMPKDHEWSAFIDKDSHFVSPHIPLRKVNEIDYPGKHHPSAQEVRAGTLERKGKYLKSYTPGWYVLSPTHLHEFKSPDYIYTQPPVMSLCLIDQKLGSHSQPGSSSHKFSLKGKQTGSMHRGHSWVFRAESYDTMMAWYADIRALTEGTGEQRIAFVRKHARSVSGGASSISGDSGMEEDEADEIPYSASASQLSKEAPRNEEVAHKRPQPGGRFPSDIQVYGHLRAPLSPSSGSSDLEHERRGHERVEVDASHYQSVPSNDPRSTSYYASGAVPTESERSYDRQDYFQIPSDQQYDAGASTSANYAPLGSASDGYAASNNQQTSQVPYHTQSQYSHQVAPTAAAYPSERLQGYPKALSPAVTPAASEPAQHQSRYTDYVIPVATGAALSAAGIDYSQHTQPQIPEQAQQPPVQQQQPAFQHHQPVTQPFHQQPYSAIAPTYTTTSAITTDPQSYNDVSNLPPPSNILQQPLPQTASLSTQPENDLVSRPTTSGTISTLPSSTGEAPFGSPSYEKYPGLVNATSDLASQPASAKPIDGLVGGESGSAAGAGGYERAMPGVSRKNTDISVSNLHIPGEFPRGTSGGF